VVSVPNSNLDAAQSGDRRLALERARDTLAEAIDGAVSRGDGTVAQLVAQYRATLTEIALMDAEQVSPKVTVLDEIASRREARSAGAADSVRPARRGKSGNG
jgi:hypothetical protein